jgi:hypothetical protein
MWVIESVSKIVRKLFLFEELLVIIAGVRRLTKQIANSIINVSKESAFDDKII